MEKAAAVCLTYGVDGSATVTRQDVPTHWTTDPTKLTQGQRLRFAGDCPGICGSYVVQQMINAIDQSVTYKDVAPIPPPAGSRCAPCPTDVKAPGLINCKQQVWDVHAPQAVYKEDFCGCAGPPIPQCAPGTMRESKNTTAAGIPTGASTRVQCMHDCPGKDGGWDQLLLDSNMTNEIDCGGWPLPELAQDSCSPENGFDACGCPQPKFKCKPGTEGSCKGFVCPVWGEAVVIDCKKVLPPVVNSINGLHVCSCEWPPAPVCQDETGPNDVCDNAAAAVVVEEVDCLGRPLAEDKGTMPAAPEWRFRFTGGCRLCDMPPAKKCRGDTHCPVQPPCSCPDTSDRGIDGIVGPNGECAKPLLTVIDCGGDKLVPPPPEECPPCNCPTEEFVCAECTDCCLGNETKCGNYVCGLGRDIAPTPEDACRTSCSRDNHCVQGFLCDMASTECVKIGKKPQPIGGCRGDKSEPCEPYSCNDVANSCMQECYADAHCSTGYGCQFSTLTGIPALPRYDTLGSDRDNGEDKPYALCGGVIGGAAGGGGTKPGRCAKIPKDPNQCTTNDPDGKANKCGPFNCGSAPGQRGACYACGVNNSQVAFTTASRCKTTCANDAHCSLNAHCDLSIGQCAPGKPLTPDSCSTKDLGYCTPYACGRHIAVRALPNAQCRTSCEEDGHCMLFYRCENDEATGKGKCVAGQIVANQYQSPAEISTKCFGPGQDWAFGDIPWKCLKVPIGVGGDPTARIAYSPPFPAPAPIVRKAIPCSKHATCKPYRCGKKDVRDADIGNSTCQVACQELKDCSQGFACLKGKCIQHRGPGAQCDVNAQCASGHCVDGICCNKACNSPCQKCTDMGICDYVPERTDYRDDCGRCQTCIGNLTITQSADNENITNYKMSCGPEEYMKDAKKACGAKGYCNGDANNTACECFNNLEGGHWAGERCSYCNKGFHGEECRQPDMEFVPPLPTTDGSPPRPMGAETRPIQFPVRVLDFSTQAQPKSVLSLLGEPDATDKYFVDHVPNMQNAWEPMQYYCQHEANPKFDGCKNKRCCAYNDGNNGDNYTMSYQYVTLEYKDAVYISDVWVYANQHPGSLVGIYAQPAQSGAAASPGGSAPVVETLANGTIATVALPKGIDLDAQRTGAADIDTLDDTAASVLPNTTTAAGTNTAPFVPVWTKSDPEGVALPAQGRIADTAFPKAPLSWVTRTNRPVVRPAQTIGFGDQAFDMEAKTKVIKAVFFMPNSGRVQIDTIGLVGFAVAQLNLTGACPGAIEVSSDASGAAPERQTPVKRAVTCSGNGKCGIKGCMCKGNWEGVACDRCKFGWQGSECTDRVPIPQSNQAPLSRIVLFEDLNDFDRDELLVRWSIQTYTPRSTRVFSARHFGTKFVSPQITLGMHSHVRVLAGFFVTDTPNFRDGGIICRGARFRSKFPDRERTPEERIDDQERVLFIKHIPYQTGINVMGTGFGDASEQMDITTQWDKPEISLEFEVWSPEVNLQPDKGNHRMTLTYFAVYAASYPSLRSSDSPDAASLN
jgi:hypothetical protein